MSIIQISKGNFASFEPGIYGFGLIYGAFIWGDLFIFSLLWFIASLILLKIKKTDYFWIFLFAFWLIRSLGEATYWFIQQFHPTTIPWPQYFPRVWILKGLEDKEFWVLNQIGWQAVAVFCIFGLIYQTTKILKQKK